MKLFWRKCQGDVWCKLNSVNLEHQHFDDLDGVYIIWHGGDDPATVRVGQGNIRERLTAHRLDPEIQKYRNLVLYVTWAKVSSQQLDGVEKFLADRLHPLVGERFPNSIPIEVNFPW